MRSRRLRGHACGAPRARHDLLHAGSTQRPGGSVNVVDPSRELDDDFLTRLRSYVRRRVPSSADGDDVFQNVLLRLVQSQASLPASVPAGSVHAWLFRVARTAVADFHRGTSGGAKFEDVSEPAQPEREDPSGIVACVEPLLASLTPLDRDLLRRIDVEGESQASIGRDLGLSPSGIKSRVQRARGRLRAALLARCVTEWDSAGRPVGDARCKDSRAPGCGCDGTRDGKPRTPRS